MNKREKILIYVMPLLAAAMITVWAPQLLKLTGRNIEPKVKSFKQDEQLRKIDFFIKDTALMARSQKSQFEMWGKDPFYASTIELEEAEAWPVKGIFWREHNPSALIGEDVVVVGDKLGDFVITNILPEAVVISDGRKVIKLQVGKSFPKP